MKNQTIESKMEGQTIKIDNIKITPGLHKYIFENENNHILSLNQKLHKDIYKTIADEVSESDVRGGKIDYNPETGDIKVFGSSGSYGKANHDAVKEILKEKLGDAYNIISESDIEKQRKLELEQKRQVFKENFGNDVEEINDLLPNLKIGVSYANPWCIA
ncbi:MAG: hypothetical protein U9R34_01520 [Nanoarchaeota archaeon]|nr:hypothetical protein [Nanoarchaeota archaeon]